MAITFSMYDHTVKKLVNKEITYSTLKVMLLDNTASFVAGNTTLTQVAGSANAKEVAMNGWDTGGETLTSVAVTQVTTNDAMLDAADVVVTATGGVIGPAYAAVVYDDTDSNDAPLLYIDFGGALTAGQDTDFKIVWNTNGLISFNYT